MWQVSKIIDNRKSYICSICSIEIAAIVNDVISIQFFGKQAKTNFNYSWIQVAALLEMKSITSVFQSKPKSIVKLP
jgi:hypothetical protein